MVTPRVVVLRALARHPQYRHSIAKLRDWGVRVLDAQTTPPSWMRPWQRVLDALPPRPGPATRAGRRTVGPCP